MDKLEQARKKLNQLITLEAPQSKIQEQSEKVDKLINEHMKGWNK